MTVKELANALLECDEDILEFQIGIVITAQISSSARLSIRCDDIRVQENADIDHNILWLKGRVLND